MTCSYFIIQEYFSQPQQIEYTTAREIWKDLNERFGQSNGSKYVQIHREISATSQGFSDIATYCTKMRNLWDELHIAYGGPTCTCGALPIFEWTE